jgi:hypothetical protein
MVPSTFLVQQLTGDKETRVLSLDEKVKLKREIANGRKKAEVSQEFGFANSMIKRVWKNRTKIVSAFEKNGLRIMRFRKSERIDVDQALLKSFKQQTTDSVPVSGLLLAIISVLPKF